jgi:hypothetical protein
MATATIEHQAGPLSDAELTRAIAAANSAVKDQQKDIEWLESQVAEETEKLAGLRAALLDLRRAARCDGFSLSLLFPVAQKGDRPCAGPVLL